MTEMNQKWKIGDCENLMRELNPNSVDLIVTDPPYGYSFMGKDWDKVVPSAKLWKECLRVLKPGAFAFIMSAPRQDVLAHNLVNLCDAGFETGFTSIYWTYASGFPKGGNIGKLVDKRNGRQPEQYAELGEYLRKMRGERRQKDIAMLFLSKTGGLTGCVANWELGLNVPTNAQWKILKRELNLDERFDELIERKEAEREITGKDKTRSNNDLIPFAKRGEYNLYNIPATPQAKKLDGSYAGFQPKPAVEVIIVVMKPLSEKTYVDQALVNGKGITWLDDGRIPYESNDVDTRRNAKGGDNGLIGSDTFKIRERHKEDQPEHSGRFPANLLVSDDILNDGKVTSGSDAVRHNNQHLTDEHRIYGKYNQKDLVGFNDSGSFSRYFDLDAWWDERVKQLPKEAQKTFPFLITPKASKSEKNGCTHPTVKPVKLFSWLITIGSRKDDLILDPFLGSGTTLEAGRFTGRRVIGFEISNDWEHLYPNRCMNHQPPLSNYT